MLADMSARFNGEVTTSDRLAMPRTPQLAAFARAAADPSRATMLVALMDERAWTVGELAQHAGIAPNTASEHVQRLVRAGLVSQARQGRHLYLTLAGPEVAHAVEAISLASDTRAAAPSLRGQRHDAELAAGRTCYRHLAGRLGVDLLTGWLAAGFVTDAWELTNNGRDWFTSIGVDQRTQPRRALLRPCIDGTERRLHAAGALADRFAVTAFERGWLIRGSHPRAARLTPAGERVLHAAAP